MSLRFRSLCFVALCLVACLMASTGNAQEERVGDVFEDAAGRLHVVLPLDTLGRYPNLAVGSDTGAELTAGSRGPGDRGGEVLIGILKAIHDANTDDGNSHGSSSSGNGTTFAPGTILIGQDNLTEDERKNISQTATGLNFKHANFKMIGKQQNPSNSSRRRPTPRTNYQQNQRNTYQQNQSNNQGAQIAIGILQILQAANRGDVIAQKTLAELDEIDWVGPPPAEPSLPMANRTNESLGSVHRDGSGKLIVVMPLEALLDN